MKKPIACLLGAVLTVGMVVGMATGCDGNGAVPLEYHYYKSVADDLGNIEEEDYNHDLVYRNDLEVLGADPSAIYITEGEEAGYYYMYNTSDPIGATGYLCYRSKNLNDWECMGVAYNPTMYIEDGVTYSAFATAMYWAPEVIYDAEQGLYFMFYNASYIFKPYTFYIDVAVSESPKGPFTQYAKWKYDTGTTEEKAAWAPVDDPQAAKDAKLEGKLKIFKPLLDFSKVPPTAELDPSWQKGDPIKTGELPGYMKVIDASPFIDEDGEKYLYFVQDLGDKHTESAICVIKLNDDWTPDYTQLKKLTVPNRATPDSDRDEASMNEGNVNEAPFMAKHGNKYYLMFSAHSYTETSYSVRVAVGDSPMGPFRKLSMAEGGWLLYREGDWASGTGHHSFVNACGSTFVVYHGHTDRAHGGGSRAVAFDEVVWIENEEGLTVPHANGPTYSYLPVVTMENRNIAKDAKVSASGMASGTDVKYLNDGVIKIHDDVAFVHEFELTTAETVITLEFEDYREVSALFIVNSYSYDTSVETVSKVEFDFKDGDFAGTAYTGALEYDFDLYYPGNDYYITGGTFAIEFKPMLVKSVRITLPKVSYERALSEIMVLGK